CFIVCFSLRGRTLSPFTTLFRSVDSAASLSVTLDSGTKVLARVIGLDSVLDLALIRIETTIPLTTARLGDSSTLRVGEEVAAIGDRKSTRLNSSHVATSYAVFCL